MAYDWRQARNQFPVLERWTYLNTATFGPVPRCAVEAANDYLRRRNDLACLDFLDWFDDADQTRAAAAALLQAAPVDIAFVTNTATALSWLVQGIDWKPGDREVAHEGEIPNNTYFGYALAQPRRLEMRGCALPRPAKAFLEGREIRRRNPEFPRHLRHARRTGDDAANRIERN